MFFSFLLSLLSDHYFLHVLYSSFYHFLLPLFFYFSSSLFLFAFFSILFLFFDFIRSLFNDNKTIITTRISTTMQENRL